MTNSSHKRAAKSGWGGKRAGAGRKPGPDASVSKVTTVVLTEDLIAKLRELGGSKWVREQIQKSGTEKTSNPDSQPSFSENTSLDLNRLLIHDPLSSLICSAPDDSAFSSGIKHGDMLIVNSKVPPKESNVVLVRHNSSYSLRRFRTEGNAVTLSMDTPSGEVACSLADSECCILGVIQYVIKSLP
mgnify:FL=1